MPRRLLGQVPLFMISSLTPVCNIPGLVEEEGERTGVVGQVRLGQAIRHDLFLQLMQHVMRRCSLVTGRGGHIRLWLRRRQAVLTVHFLAVAPGGPDRKKIKTPLRSGRGVDVVMDDALDNPRLLE